MSGVVLLVEDDVDIGELMAEVLTLQGISTALARNGLEALLHLRAQPPPGLILLDLMMPVMDGFQFRDEQRAVPGWSEIPVVILSAAAGLEDKARVLGADGFLAKPVDSNHLLEVVRRYVA
ncbi:MAG: hypothetical protein NVSMB25_26160 [Thermoleophilaceae bacterium]